MPVREKMLLFIQNRTPITSQAISNISPSPIPPKIYYAAAVKTQSAPSADINAQLVANAMFQIEQYLAFYEAFSNSFEQSSPESFANTNLSNSEILKPSSDASQ
jgi:hypothetical protein